MRGGLLALAFGFALSARADEAWTYRYASGDSATYAVKQTSNVEEVIIDETTKKPLSIITASTVTSRKQWTVKSVEKDGSAALELTLLAIKQEIVQTVGSDKPNVRTVDSSVEADAKEMPFLGKPILTVVLSASGEFVSCEAKDKVATDRLKAELPFRATLPGKVPAAKETWERKLTLKSPPPFGTGERVPAVQTFTFRGLKDDFAVIGLTTKPSEKVDDADLPGLVPLLWDGDVFYDTKANRYHGSRLKSSREIASHKGEGTKYKYTSDYTEALEAKK